MKSRGIGLGLFVLTIGIIWLLFNFNILDWRLLESLWVLWPLVFVVIGINIMFRHNPNVRIGVWLVFLAVVIGYSLYIDKDSSRHSAAAQHNIIQYNKSGEKSSVLDLDLGGYKFDIDSTEGALLEGNVYGPGIKHSINRSGNAAVVKIKDSKYFFKSYSNNSCDLLLNKDVTWTLDLDVGAYSGNFDLRDIDLEKLDIDSGAGKMELYLGSKSDNTIVDIDAGASSFNIHVPSDAGVRVKLDGGINNSNLSGLGWEKSGGYYTSPNYNGSNNKIQIDTDMGVGKFDITVD
jgi:hypothetical protein